MNFLLVNYEYPPLGGGAGNATMFIARALLELGHRAVVLTSRFGDQAMHSAEEGVIVHRLKVHRRAPDRSSQREMASFMIAAVRSSRAIARANRIDALITFFTIPSAPVGWWIWRTMRLPYVVSLRGGDVPGHVPGLDLIHRVLTPIRRAALGRAVAVVANSASLAGRSQRADPVPVLVIPNGVDGDFFRPAERPYQESSGKFRVLFVGRVHAEKNVDLLLRALAALTATDRTRIQLDIVGDGPARPTLEKLAQALGIDPQITWHGWRSKQDVAALYREVDCLANPSAYEGMPNTVLEAMASALPVIASDVGGNNEVVRPAETGFLFQLPDVLALRDCIVTLLNDPQLCTRMGARGRAVVLAEHSWRSVAQRYAALMELAAGDVSRNVVVPNSVPPTAGADSDALRSSVESKT